MECPNCYHDTLECIWDANAHAWICVCKRRFWCGYWGWMTPEEMDAKRQQEQGEEEDDHE